MVSVAARLVVAASVAVGALTLTACVGSTAEIGAEQDARALVDSTVETVAADVAVFDGSDFVSFVTTGGVRLGVSFYGLTKEEVAERRVSGVSSVLLDAIEEGDIGTIELLTMGFGEGGGDLAYEQALSYVCWALDVDLDSLTVSPPRNVECPDVVGEFVRNAKHITL